MVCSCFSHVMCYVKSLETSRISDCSHFHILVSIRTALLANIKFGEGLRLSFLCYVYSKDKTTESYT